MMEIDDDTLMALADGEITGDVAARLHARIASEPDLAARYALFVQSAYWVKESALADPGAGVSPDLRARVRQSAETDTPAAERGARSDKAGPLGPLGRRMPRWRPVALAASLALAVGVSTGVLLAPDAPVRDATALTADLRDRLGRLPSGSQADLSNGRRVTVVASFTDGAGAFCREYETRGTGAAGYVSVACRKGDAWDLRFAMATSGGTGGYAPAASLAALDAFYAATGASQPLAPAEEQRFLQ
jgi:hypothetical protein